MLEGIPDWPWLKIRRHDPPGESPLSIEKGYRDKFDPRSLEEKDRDKILYSPFLRRLGGVSQVVPSGIEQKLHNRLTHSLEVSQLARRLAEVECEHNPDHQIFRICPAVAEAAGLAHDLGHPPFGHVGERALNEILLAYRNPRVDDLSKNPFSIGGFEGNAQTLRILGSLSVSYGRGHGLGLNLTRRTILSTVKYPWQRGAGESNGKFGVYPQRWDKDVFQWLLSNPPTSDDSCQLFRTPECEIMDYADDVVYSLYDVSDFYREGLIDLSRLADEDDPTFKQFVDTAQQIPKAPLYNHAHSKEKLLEARRRLLQDVPPKYDGSLSVERALGAWMVNVMDDLTLPSTTTPGQRPFAITSYYREVFHGRKVWRCAKIEDAAALAIDILKSLTWVYVINSSFELQVLQRRADTMLKKLVWYFDWALVEHRKGLRHHWRLLAPYVHLIDEVPAGRYEQVRLAADIVAAMTDQEVEHYYSILNLASFGDL